MEAATRLARLCSYLAAAAGPPATQVRNAAQGPTDPMCWYGDAFRPATVADRGLKRAVSAPALTPLFRKWTCPLRIGGIWVGSTIIAWLICRWRGYSVAAWALTITAFCLGLF